MEEAMEKEQRKNSRLETSLAMRFNLNPDYHFVPGIRKMGVGGTIRNICSEGICIVSELDLLDVCQIFPEAIEDGATFQLEVQLTDYRERRLLIRGVVKWYQIREPERNVRHFQAGLYLRDGESRAIANNIVESLASAARDARVVKVS
jgi:hypothetical protein